MKKIFMTLLILASIININVTNVLALESTDIYSNEALVVNINTDEILYSKNTIEESVEIASLTKIMTYVIAIENIEDLNTKIVIPNGTRQDIINKNGSNAGLEDGYEYTVLDILYGLMLPSGCDAAEVLAKYISNNDYSKFIQMMNNKAKELDMNNTIYYSASGLEENGNNNVSTEQDLYKLAKYAFDLPYFKEIIGTEFYEITGVKDEIKKTNTVRNTNYMMGEYNGAEYYYQYSLGGKTGNTSGAGRCLISYSKKGELEIVAITLGVPNQHSNYHLTDHIKLFDYVYEKYTNNIIIDIGSEYKSVKIGEKIQIIPTTSENTKITWTSSDETVATVNEYGIVTGKKLGQAKIIATTETGNQDYTYVSVGFYNGIDVKYSSGPKDPNGILGYGEIDWKLVKDYGMDYAIIRAGYALGNNPDSDPYFVKNIEGAITNEINIMISFDGYATDESYAEKEAEYLINYLNEFIPEHLDKIKLPIVYNLFNSSVSDPIMLVKVIKSFNNKMQENGYDVIVELGRTKFTTLELSEIEESEIGIYVAWRPYVPDFTTQMNIVKGDKIYKAMLWSYRTDGYFGEVGITKSINMAVMYMDYFEIITSHEKHDDSLYPEIPTLEIENNYEYTGNIIEAEISGFDPDTMTVSGNKETEAGTYTITVKPKEKWKNGSKEEITILWEIEKAKPTVSIPNLSAKNNTKLKDIELPVNLKWKNENETIDKNKENKFIAIYTPDDTKNYNIIEIELLVNIIEEEHQKKDYYEINNDMTVNNIEEDKEIIIYEIKNKDNLEYNKNENKDLTIEIESTSFLSIKNIFIDDIKITKEEYQLEKTNIKITKEFLNNLKEGRHTIKIIYQNNGETNGYFNVIKEETLKEDNTSKENNKPIVIIAIIVAIITIVTLIIIKTKKK